MRPTWTMIRRLRRSVLPLAAASLAATIVIPGPPIGEREVVTLSVSPIDVELLDSPAPLPETRIDPAGGGNIRAALAWPGPVDRSELTVAARSGPASGGGRRVTLTATLRLPDGRRVRTERTTTVEDERTVLVELHRAGGRPLTLAIRLAVEREPFVDIAPTPGRPVRMLLELQRVDAGRVVSLETNQLQSFVGRTVRYSFRIGDGDGGTHDVRIALRPERVRGALATIHVDLEGSLPTAHGPSIVARSESIVLNRGATSTLAVETGSPPSGYRFLLRARF